MVDGFLRQSGGAVEIHSAVGQGTAVTLYFPVVAGEVLPEETIAEPEGPENGTERILLVDDDEQVAVPTRDLLVDLGYSVMLASSGEQALRMLSVARTPIDILITDVVMPGKLDGLDLARAVLQRLPNLPVIYITGHSEAVAGIASGQVLLKPFRRCALADAVHSALASRQPKVPAYGSGAHRAADCSGRKPVDVRAEQVVDVVETQG
jgi:DNA-binding NtrC family response regulator